VKPFTYYNWVAAKKPKGRKALKKKRRPTVETALVPTEPPTATLHDFRKSTGTNGPVNLEYAADVLASMNARSLRTLLGG
jgi:hypothetical protein